MDLDSGLRGLYKISSTGQILSYHRDPDGRVLKTQRSQTGYITADLRNDKHCLVTGVHRLVLLSFEGKPKKGHQARHLNGVRSDNHLENLCWGSAKDNADDRDRHGTTARGERSSQAKLSDRQVRKLRELYDTGRYTFQQLADKFCLQKAHVSRAVRGVSWKHVRERKEYQPQPRSNDHKLNAVVAVEIRKSFNTGRYTTEQLARRYGVAGATIVGVVRNNYYVDAGGPDCRGVRLKEKLNVVKAEKIRRLYASGRYTQKQLGLRFGVTRGAIYSVVSGQNWK